MKAVNNNIEPKHSVATKSYSSISDLLNSSWNLVRLSWKKLLVLSLIVWGIFFALILLGAGTAVGVFMTSLGDGEVASGAIGIALGLVVLAVIAVLAVGSVYSTSLLLALDEADTNPSIRSLISRAIKLLIPVFITSLIVFFLVYGGFGLLIIPGIIIALLTSFSLYEIIFFNNRPIAAITNSVRIVSQNFGELFKRLLVIIGISVGLFIINVILSAILGDNNAGQSVLSLVWSVIQMVFSWFVIAYYLKTYREARANTDLSTKISLLWMWIVAIVGWIAVGFIVSVGLRALSNTDFQEMIEDELMQEQQYDFPMNQDGIEESNLDTEALLLEYGQDMTEEEQAQFRQMLEQAETMAEQDQQIEEQEDQI